MGLAAFVIFVIPWMLLAIWLFRLPSAIRLGAPSAPWRPLTPGRDWLREQERRETNRRKAAAAVRPGSTSGEHREPSVPMRDGGSLGPSVEDTEPKE